LIHTTSENSEHTYNFPFIRYDYVIDRRLRRYVKHRTEFYLLQSSRAVRAVSSLHYVKILTYHFCKT